MMPKLGRIVITGAGSGLGRGLAAYFAERRAHLVLLDHNAAALEETGGIVGRQAASLSIHVVDVSSGAEIRKFEKALADLPAAVLINNAGLQQVSKVEDLSEESWDRLLDVMLRGTFLLTQAVLPRMRRANFGRIINIGSIHSLVASPFKSAYVAAKHGLLGFAKTVALETADADVTINTICPSYVRTPLVDAQIAAQAKSHGISEAEVIDRIMLEPMPKKRFITIEEIAGAIEFLISPAARNITGQSIVIDGGWTAR
jgi:3-hydroxybutyrate dehydrogenase